MLSMSKDVTDIILEKLNVIEASNRNIADRLARLETRMDAFDARCSQHTAQLAGMEATKDRLFGSWKTLSVIAAVVAFLGGLAINVLFK